MAESTLAITFDDLKKAVAHQLGKGVVEAKWSAGDLVKIDMIIKRGLRQFYFPSPIFGISRGRQEIIEPPYEWSFLKPIATLTTVASYITGTVAVVSGVCTLIGGVWPSWAAEHGTLVIDTVEYAITTRDGDTQLTVVGDDVTAGAEYSLVHDGNYDLPDDFGGIEGRITYEPSENKPEIIIVGEGKIRSQRSNTTRSYPSWAAIRPKEHLTTTVGQRFEIMFDSIPDDVYILSYRKQILPSMLVDTTLTYPYGGAVHSETILASCLAMAELQESNIKGALWENFKTCLAASIRHDKTFKGVEYFGKNSDNSGDVENNTRSANRCTITYHGEEY